MREITEPGMAFEQPFQKRIKNVAVNLTKYGSINNVAESMELTTTELDICFAKIRIADINFEEENSNYRKQCEELSDLDRKHMAITRSRTMIMAIIELMEKMANKIHEDEMITKEYVMTKNGKEMYNMTLKAIMAKMITPLIYNIWRGITGNQGLDLYQSIYFGYKVEEISQGKKLIIVQGPKWEMDMEKKKRRHGRATKDKAMMIINEADQVCIKPVSAAEFTAHCKEFKEG